MSIKAVTLLIVSILVFNSCCFTKEEYLGNNFILSEYDNVDRRILYSEKTCTVSGIEIVPMTVLEYAYDSKWIIAKSGSRENVNYQYWIIDKDFKVDLIKDNDSTLNIIRSHVNGPNDSSSFVKQLRIAKINLVLKKI